MGVGLSTSTTEVGRISHWAKTRLAADQSNRQAMDGSSRFPKSVVSIPDTSVARRKRHVPSLTVESTPCFEYSRLALHLGGLPRFSRAPSQLGVHSAARSTSFNPFEYARGSAR